MKQYLAIDYGTKRIGLAVNRAILAEPLMILKNKPGLLAEIEQVIKDEQIEQIIIGLSENKMAQKTKNFAQKLQERLNVSVRFYDETLTSQEARHKLQQAKKSKREKPLDHYAAALILERWLADNFN